MLNPRILRRATQRFYLSIFQKTFPHPTLPEPFAYPQSQPQENDEIVVAMSSGVDSSVTAALLTEKFGAGRVRGIYMANWSQTAKCTEGEWNDVQKVCAQLEIPCERVNFEKEYWSDVFSPMIEMYEQGMTPNPDLGCNKYIKFGKMVEHLKRRSGSGKTNWWLATGHYARVEHRPDGNCNLIRGFDGNKDQSYYLASIAQGVLSNVLMPLGHFTKPQVREMARSRGICTAEKPDSVGLCFVSPDHTKFRHFLDEYIPPNPGNIVTEDGRVWGTHQGLWHATIGQKLGISMPQGDPNFKGIWFVSEKRVESNEIVIVKGGNNEALFKDSLDALEWQWFGDQPNSFPPLEFQIQYRSLQTPIPVQSCELLRDNKLRFNLDSKQRAMAPGQNVVLYKGNQIMGSGVLTRAYNSDL